MYFLLANQKSIFANLHRAKAYRLHSICEISTSVTVQDHDNIELTAEGRTILPTEETTFTVTINPKNRGVRLRRMLDYSKLNQKAMISVDGKEVGIWLTAGNNSFHSFREEEFLIDAQFTKGKEKLLIGIQPLPYKGHVMKDGQQPDPHRNKWMEREIVKEGPWTEMRYKVYSIVDSATNSE